MKGWVYIITNKAMPGLIKVGFSTKDPELRAREFGGTHSPHPFIVEYEVLVNNPYKYEQLAHKELESYRENKEWFRCGLEQGISAVKTVIGAELITEDIKHINRQQIEESIKQKEQEEKKESENAKRIQEEKRRERVRKSREEEKRRENEFRLWGEREEEESRKIQIEIDRLRKQKDKLTIKRITEQIDADTKLRIEGFPYLPATYMILVPYVYMILLGVGPTFSTFLPYVNYHVMIFDDGTFGPYGTNLGEMLFWAFSTCLMYAIDLIGEYKSIKESSNKRRGWGLDELPYFTNTKIKQLLAIFLCLLCVIAFSIVIII